MKEKQTLKTLPKSRRQALLEAAAEVSRHISSILTLDELLTRTVDIICDAYDFYYAGIFLLERLDDGKSWAVLKAGRGEAGQHMLRVEHKLLAGGKSMIGMSSANNEARVTLDVEQEQVRFRNPHLPETQSEMALPLAVAGEVIGALTVQSAVVNAFSGEDVFSLQGVADQLAVAIHNARLHEQNQQLLVQASRQATLLQVGAIVSRNISSILELEPLLSSTVDIICEAYDFYYAGIFLVAEPDEEAEEGDERVWAVLKAGRGEAGRQMLAAKHRLLVGGNSMVGTAVAQGQARLSLAVDETQVWYPNPYLPDTRSEMALPLIVHGDVIGALSVQSVLPAAFSEEDISTLQMMADQLAVAINNAQLLQDLEQANKDLVRFKTYETIAAATGETIHWVGNKAAPVPACVERLREDVGRFVLLAAETVEAADETVQAMPFAQTVLAAQAKLAAVSPNAAKSVEPLRGKSARKLQRLVDVESIFEDLEIIEESANIILEIKEDLLGPARQQKLAQADVVKVIDNVIKGFGLRPGVVTRTVNGDVPAVKIDPTQFGRVLINLIKNALEAMEGQPMPRVFIAVRHEEAELVRVDVADIGPGIPEEEMTNIWMMFHTTKGKKGGTGLGLPACLQIMENMGGKINVTSKVGFGSTFTLLVPVYQAHL